MSVVQSRIVGGPRDLLALGSGFVLWSVAFTVLYGSLSIGCLAGWDGRSVGPVDLNRAVLIGWWLAFSLAGAALAVLLWRQSDRGGSPMARAMRLSNVAAAASTVWTGLPIVLATSSCA